MGRLHTCYSPVRRSPSKSIATFHAAPRLACVKPVASVHPEPGSNSSLFIYCLFLFSKKSDKTSSIFVLPSQYHRISFALLVFTPRFLWIDRESFLTLVLLRLLQLCQCSFALFKCAKVLQRYNLFYSRQNIYQLFFDFYFFGALECGFYRHWMSVATASLSKASAKVDKIML